MNPVAVDVDKAEVSRIARAYGLDLVILFGSRAKGRARKGSDIDVAVRKNKNSARGAMAEEEVELELSLIGELADAIQARDGDIDVVFLNHASPLLMFQVARHGAALFEAEPLLFAHFKSYAARLYDTDRKFYEAQRRYLRKKFSHVG